MPNNTVTRFKPGRSGNPGGRPKRSRDIAELARRHTSEAISALVEALSEKGERVAAAKVLLAYGYGNPIPPTTDAGGNPLIEGSLASPVIVISPLTAPPTLSVKDESMIEESDK